MSKIHKRHILPPWRLLVTNYIGGLGYYGWHFAWILTAFLLSLRIMQFWVFGSEPILYTPSQTTQVATLSHTESSFFVQLFATIITVALSVGIVIFMACLPYWIGYVSRTVPRWCLAQTSWRLNAKMLYRAKLTGVMGVFVCAIPSLYYPGGSAFMNLGFFIVSVSCLFAFVCFWVQYTIAAHWNIPERRIF